MTAALLLMSGCSADSSEEEDETSGQSQSPEGPSAEDPGGDGSGGNERVSEASAAPGSVHVLVNKATPLDPEDYEPEDLEVPDVPQDNGGQELSHDAAKALEALFAAAESEGLSLSLVSAYRGFDYQETVYNGYVAESGQEAADAVSARPGHSEHQTGLAADISFAGNEDCLLRKCFAETEEGQWLAENGPDHGFIIRYPEGDTDVTGFDYEPWHLRYLGEETAAAVEESGLPLEEYWGEPAAPDYPDAP